MASMKVKHRLTLGFGLVIVVIAASMGIAVSQISSLRASVEETSSVHVPRAKAANDIIDAVNAHARSVRTMLLADSQDMIDGQIKQAEASSREVTAAFEVLTNTPGSAESMQLQQEAQTSRTGYRNDYATFIQLFKEGKKEEARKFLLSQMRNTQLVYMDQVNKLIKLEQDQSQQLANQSSSQASRTEWVLMISAGVTLLLAIIAGWLISRSLMSELGGEPAEARKLMEELAEGEVTTTLNLKKGDDSSLFAYMSKAAQQAIENIRVRKALDAAGTNVMIADASNRIIYMNEAVLNLFRAAEADIRKEIPSFSANNILGSSMDTFHRNPSHQQRLIKDLRQTHNGTIKIGGRTLTISATPVFGKSGAVLGTTVEWQDKTAELAMQEREQERLAEERKLSEENARIRSALDNVSTSVMIADPNGNIIYMNRSVQELMQNAESDIRKDLPNFEARGLLGRSFDGFHKTPSHQRDMLANLRGTHRTQIKVGGRTFSLAASPVFTAGGDRLGTAVEWRDRTLEVQVEEEVSAIVSAASRGDFEHRVRMEGKEGFFKMLGEALNSLLDVTSNGLQDIANVLSAVAKGDLTHTIHSDYQGLFGTLKQDTNTTVERLREIVTNIKESTDSINTASREIAAGNANLSSRTEQQAASLEETASSMEEITSTVRQNADNAKKANQLAIGSSDIASRGGQVVGQVVSTMSEINESARKIVDIISVIDGIAFQTNILALNAAVEAARAGEQGRGFAVVASEVRNLAQRSAGAAKEIKGLIGDSVEKVESGSRLVDEAGRTMQEIVSAITRVTDIMSEISAASVEQSSGIEQVNLAVTQMDENTQKNAALVEEAAAAAESLEEQARNLAEAVALFKLKEGDKSVRRDAPAQVVKPVATPVKPASVAQIGRAPAGERVLPKPESHAAATPAPRIAQVSATREGEGEWEEF
ncbi:methyl-accepting chemotaxis protein [Paludibacterium sp. B53371]|uniref:methyl-accepting chemotaxis protein n=1 Tax=Paludibacterium sp. B53371 TaxID=2806263 RepID=UPI001C05B2A2